MAKKIKQSRNSHLVVAAASSSAEQIIVSKFTACVPEMESQHFFLRNDAISFLARNLIHQLSMSYDDLSKVCQLLRNAKIISYDENAANPVLTYALPSGFMKCIEQLKKEYEAQIHASFKATHTYGRMHRVNMFQELIQSTNSSLRRMRKLKELDDSDGDLGRLSRGVQSLVKDKDSSADEFPQEGVGTLCSDCGHYYEVDSNPEASMMPHVQRKTQHCRGRSRSRSPLRNFETSHGDPILRNLTEELSDISLEDIGQLSELLTPEILPVIIGLNKMQESRPKTVKSLHRVLSQFCRYTYIVEASAAARLSQNALNPHCINMKHIIRRDGIQCGRIISVAMIPLNTRSFFGYESREGPLTSSGKKH